nr:hypothetical protein [Luteimicrobium album]
MPTTPASISARVVPLAPSAAPLSCTWTASSRISCARIPRSMGSTWAAGKSARSEATSFTSVRVRGRTALAGRPAQSSASIRRNPVRSWSASAVVPAAGKPSIASPRSPNASYAPPSVP